MSHDPNRISRGVKAIAAIVLSMIVSGFVLVSREESAKLPEARRVEYPYVESPPYSQNQRQPYEGDAGVPNVPLGVGAQAVVGFSGSCAADRQTGAYNLTAHFRNGTTASIFMPGSEVAGIRTAKAAFALNGVSLYREQERDLEGLIENKRQECAPAPAVTLP